MTHEFRGKVALVTGAASGMGLATARSFAQAGASVALADLRGDAARAAADELVRGGHEAIGIGCDVTDEANVAAMVEQTIAAFGRLDAAFNNAGVNSLAVETADGSRPWPITKVELGPHSSMAATRYGDRKEQGGKRFF